MRSLYSIFAVLAVILYLPTSAVAQLTNWEYSTTVDITETRGNTSVDDQVLIIMNTADLIANGQMKSDGSDIRFAADCDGSNLLFYYIEAGINTDSTKIWVRLPLINAFTTNTYYFFSGNAAAVAPTNAFNNTFPSQLIISANTTLAGPVDVDWFEIQAGVTVSLSPGVLQRINANKVLINGALDGEGDGSDGGLLNTTGNGAGAGLYDGPADAGGGAGYGGAGGDAGSAGGSGGPTYGSATDFSVLLGSGGGGNSNGAFTNPGGSGGGAVSIAAYEIEINGSINMAGQPGAPSDGSASVGGAGGGSGGTILGVAEYITYGGSADVSGGAGGSASGLTSNGGGGGAGGRVKGYFYNTGNFAGLTPDVSGGTAGTGTTASGVDGGAGSIATQQFTGATGIVISPLQTVSGLDVLGDDTLCINTTETYTASVAGSYTYLWSATGGTITGGQSTNTVTIDWTTAGAQTLQLIVTNLTTGCTDTASGTVFVSDVFPVATAGALNFDFCPGEDVQFADLSTIASGNIVEWLWDFGDGSTSTNQNPLHNFAFSGIFNVSLTVTSDLGCSNTQVIPTQVVDPPVAGFSATEVCLGEATAFTNLSTVFAAPTVSWDFGDGVGTSAAVDPTYTYTAPGTYTVTLTISYGGLCVDVATSTVVVNPLPQVDFSIASACPGDNVTFTSLSTIASSEALTYAWDFGDGNTGTGATATNAYTAEGSYTATLVVTSASGCIDSLSKTFDVYPVPVPNFTFADVCDGDAVDFTNATAIASGSVSHSWDFGDGNSSTDINPSHTYAGPGDYIIQLTTTSGFGCTASFQDTVTVNLQPVSSFTAANECDGDTVRFTNNSTVATNVVYTWDFGDGNSSTMAAPNYLYGTSGTYTVTLAATDTLSGCTDTSTLDVTVYPEPTAAFTADNVCSGNAVAFVDQATVSQGTLTYGWDFGDGTNSTSSNPTHLYAGPGTYTVTMAVTTQLGCTDTVTGTVTVYVQPVAGFTVSNECDGDTAVFTNTSSTGTDIVYGWDFGDGNTSSEAAPQHLYGAPGTYTVTLIATDTIGGCADTTTGTITIWDEPVASFTAPDECFGTAIQFTDASTLGTGTLTYAWDFGDGNTSNDINPSHLYDTTGIFNVTLTITTDKGCEDVFTESVIVFPKPVTDFSVGIACFGNPTPFTNLTTIDFGTITYEWNFDDGTAIDTATNPVHNFGALGVYTVELTATSDQGCVMTYSEPVDVNPLPAPDFFVDDACELQTTTFNNTSSIASGSMTYFWEFGDGFTSIAQDPDYAYTDFGTYTVQLTATSDEGCIDSTSKTIDIHDLPTVAFVAPNVCIGETTNFTNLTTVNGASLSDYVWDFDNNNFSILSDPANTYDAPGTYLVNLRVTTNQGCIDSLAQAVVVHDLPPADIQALGPTSFCRGDSVELSAPSGEAGYLWSTGEVTQNIVVSDQGWVYVTVTSIFGCTNTDSIFITVWELPNIDAGNDTTISKGFDAFLHATGGVSYEWDNGATLDNASSADPVATPLETTTYTVTGTDENGCVNTDSVTVTVNEDYLIFPTNVITPNGDGKNDFWFIVNILTYPNSNVVIFDRYGTKVFEASAYDNSWFGENGDTALPEGPYFYVITFDGVDDVIYKGSVSILR